MALLFAFYSVKQFLQLCQHFKLATCFWRRHSDPHREKNSEKKFLVNSRFKLWFNKSQAHRGSLSLHSLRLMQLYCCPVKKTEEAPPLAGLCWFNPGGQQLALTAARHQRVIYWCLRVQRWWPLGFDPLAVLSATHHQGDDAQTHRPSVIQRPPATSAQSSVADGETMRKQENGSEVQQFEIADPSINGWEKQLNIYILFDEIQKLRRANTGNRELWVHDQIQRNGLKIAAAVMGCGCSAGIFSVKSNVFLISALIWCINLMTHELVITGVANKSCGGEMKWSHLNLNSSSKKEWESFLRDALSMKSKHIKYIKKKRILNNMSVLIF